MKPGRIVFALVILAAGFIGGFGYGRWYMKPAGSAAGEKGGRKVLYWVDPMHPAYKSDKPGIAPDCGMKLEPVYADEGEKKTGGKIVFYRDPQDPKYTSDKPGLNPETGSELEPVYEGDPASMPPGSFRVSPEKQQIIGVKYGTAEYESGGRTIRAVGKVAVDETRIARIHSRVEGWIDKVYIDFTGKLVEKGQPLLTLYSPEMLATQQEYLLALRARNILKDSTLPLVSEDNSSLVQAARRRLQLWDLSDAQIDEIERTGKPITNITVYSPITGYVTARNAFPKQKIGPDTELYTISDLSRVWIMADVFEYESADIRVGQHATITLSYSPGRPIHARVSYIQPQVDPATRTLKVRLDADNPGLMLKPDMFVDAEFAVGSARRLTVPVNAVLNSGLRQTVFVDRGNGYLEARQVEAGERLGDRVVIASGLKAGERIVVSGTFLIDSESQMKAAASDMGAPAGGHAGHTAPAPAAAQPAPGGHQHD